MLHRCIASHLRADGGLPSLPQMAFVIGLATAARMLQWFERWPGSRTEYRSFKQTSRIVLGAIRLTSGALSVFYVTVLREVLVPNGDSAYLMILRVLQFIGRVNGFLAFAISMIVAKILTVPMDKVCIGIMESLRRSGFASWMAVVVLAISAVVPF